jgi:hypothetical protein
MKHASIAPSLDADIHLVLCRFGRAGLAYVETDPAEADATTVIQNLLFAQALIVLISGRSWKGRRGSGGRLERNARNPALILGYNKGPGRGGRASASAVREPPARLRTALIRIAQRPPGLHAERPWRRTAGLSGSVRHLNNERKRFAFRVDAGDDQPWPAALRPSLMQSADASVCGIALNTGSASGGGGSDLAVR